MNVKCRSFLDKKEAKMGVIYYGMCLDCKQYVDLGKFYSRAGYAGTYNQLKEELEKDLNEYKNDDFIYPSLKLHFFIQEHQGHRLGIYDENDFDDMNYPDSEDPNELDLTEIDDDDDDDGIFKEVYEDI